MTRVEIFNLPETKPKETVLRLRLMRRHDVFPSAVHGDMGGETLLVAVDENGDPLSGGVLGSVGVSNPATGKVTMYVWQGVDTDEIPIAVDGTGSRIRVELI